ncbi:MAG: hypothetical protein AVDCRST_MAG93-7470, partial [uncultured Chloroflexia bacterium]
NALMEGGQAECPAANFSDIEVLGNQVFVCRL